MANTKRKNVLCPSCGFKNAHAERRCVSCGSKIELSSHPSRNPDDDQHRRSHSGGFSIVWMLAAVLVLGVLTAAVVMGLPMVVDALDFEGIYGMYICVPVWFVGGLLVGLVSPGRTYIETMVASLFIAVPTVFYLVQTQTVRTMPTFMYVIIGCAGIVFSVIGAYLGERVQMDAPPRPVD